jgi:hypothetical protein
VRRGKNKTKDYTRSTGRHYATHTVDLWRGRRNVSEAALKLWFWPLDNAIHDV